MTQATGAAARPRPQPASRTYDDIATEARASADRASAIARDAAVTGPLFGMPLDRSFPDVIAGRIRIRLAGEEWVLPVLSVGEGEAWLASLDGQTNAILADIPEEDLAGMMRAVLALGVDTLLGFLYAYDKSGVLPRDPEFRGRCYPNEFLPAVWEVSLAANPTADLAVTAAVAGVRMARETADVMARIAPTKPSPPSTAGRRRKSAKS